MSARDKFPLKHEGERFITMYHSGSICAVRSEICSVTDQKSKVKVGEQCEVDNERNPLLPDPFGLHGQGRVTAAAKVASASQ